MSEPETTWILIYEYVADILEQRTPHREQHLARIGAEREAGHVVVAGAYGSPPQGAVFGFKGITREQVEAFAENDPYTKHGLVVKRTIEPWAIVKPAEAPY